VKALAKCLIISSEFPPGPGGVGSHAYELSANLVDLGWEIQVITRQDYVDNPEAAAFNSTLPFHTTPLAPKPSPVADFLYRWRAVTSAIREFAPDVVVATGNARIVLLAILANWPNRRPIVAVGHGTEFGARGIVGRTLARLAYSHVTSVICVSEFTKTYMYAAGIRPKSAHVIPNGANESVFRRLTAIDIEAFRSRNGLEGKTVLVTVGHVTERKGQAVVIEALPLLVKEFPEVLYVAVGLPTCAETLRKRAEQLGVSGHVRFAGRVTTGDVVHYLNAASLNIMTSRHTANGDFEGYGIAVVEAALCGTPSVVAGNSGLIEAVDYGQTGVIVPENDADATAAAIIGLLRDRERLIEMAEAAYTRAVSEKRWSQRIYRYAQVLETVKAP
jgi:phosphatidylinositol alpha-1,6-mannosyltransferase